LVKGGARRLWSDESGATVIEHGILICVIALVIVTLVGSGLSPSMFLRSVSYLADSVLAGGDPTEAVGGDPPAVGE
jgi:Flp pilus assembly pilin Flp